MLASVDPKAVLRDGWRVIFSTNSDARQLLGIQLRGPDLSTEGFDPGSERTLAAWLRHASRTRKESFGSPGTVAEGCVIRGQSTLEWGITLLTES